MKVYKDNVGRVWYIDGTDIFDEDGAPLPTQKKIDEENTRVRKEVLKVKAKGKRYEDHGFVSTDEHIEEELKSWREGIPSLEDKGADLI